MIDDTVEMNGVCLSVLPQHNHNTPYYYAYCLSVLESIRYFAVPGNPPVELLKPCLTLAGHLQPLSVSFRGTRRNISSRDSNSTQYLPVSLSLSRLLSLLSPRSMVLPFHLPRPRTTVRTFTSGQDKTSDHLSALPNTPSRQ